jgi:hypothetical protein
MKRLLIVWVMVAALPAFAQRGGGNTRPLQNYAASCASDVSDEANCAGYERNWCVNYSTDIIYACSPDDHGWHAVGSGGGGGGSSDFDTILAGTLGAGSYLVGSGATFAATGTGTIQATETVKLTIDGVHVTVPKGTLVIVGGKRKLVADGVARSDVDRAFSDPRMPAFDGLSFSPHQPRDGERVGEEIEVQVKVECLA